MGKKKGTNGLEVLRLYRAPRVGALLLVCDKCPTKLIESGRARRQKAISDALDHCTAQATDHLPLRVMQVGCMKECPKDGVTLCALRAGAQFRPQPIAVHNAAEVEVFFAGQIAPAAAPREPHVDSEMVSEAGLEPATVSLEG